MVMFLMAMCISVFGLAVCAIAFGAATRDERRQPELSLDQQLALAPQRFFAEDRTMAAAQPQVPLEVLLLQIERHVRLEQAAAESFIDFPTRESLHCRTVSPLVH
jgi:hypothetical protein